MFFDRIFLLLISALSWTAAENLLTVTPDGPVNGRIQLIADKSYGVYIGIPYAQPPVGPLRLRDPQAVVPRTSILDATGNFKPNCPQPPFNNATMSEDCLYLNVFTPVTSAADNRKFAVLFWIHGGYLISGGANKVPVKGILENLVSRDVVVVTINYRLGALGFFNTRSAEVAGNFGFLDQTVALEWVKRNIDSYGGDPNKVTIAGQSAGAICVSALTLSPWSQGLFSQALMMSGSMFYQNLMADDPTVDVSAQLGQKIGCWSKGAADRSILTCMQSASVESIVNTKVSVPANTRPWMARIDNRFFPDSAKNLAKNRPKINVMIGTNKDEYGILNLGPTPWSQEPTIYTTPAEIAKNSIPAWITQTKFGPQFSVARGLAQYHYISQKSQEAANLDPSERPEFWFNSDVQLKSSLGYFLPSYLDATQYLSNQRSSVFLYSFDHETSIFLSGEYFWRGAYHGSELTFLFGTRPTNSSTIAFDIGTDQQIKNLTNTLSDCWTNFVKFGRPTQGNPSGDWRPTDNFLFGYFSIKSNSTSMEPSYRSEMKSFWVDTVPPVTGVTPA